MNKGVIFLVLWGGFSVLTHSQANILDFARDWSQRFEEDEPPMQDQHYISEKKQVIKKKQSKLEHQTRAKENVKVTSQPVVNQRGQPIQTTVTATGETIPEKLPANLVLPDASHLADWLYTVWQRLLFRPSETELRGRYQSLLVTYQELKKNALADLQVQHQLQEKLDDLEQKLKNKESEIRQLSNHAEGLKQKSAQWQTLTHKLQASLKEAQHPPLPATEDGITDFAAGMAMGIDILEFLEQRGRQGVQIDNMIFLAGITETLRDERRLSQEQFEAALLRANLRVEQARIAMMKQRKLRDQKWLDTFSASQNVRKAGDVGWFRVLHVGEHWPSQMDDRNEFSIAVKRQLTDGTQIADSDLNGLIFQEKIHDFPEWLQMVIRDTRLHGEAELAVKVNDYGQPWDKGEYVEHWIIRVAEIITR